MDNSWKLHFSTDAAIEYRYRKIKSVISALGVDIKENPLETFTNLKGLCPIATLPILETPEGNFSSSNTIIRFLASCQGFKLYGGDNLHNRALIDQWLDLQACDFDTCALAVNIIMDGKEVNMEAVSQDVDKFLSHLNKHLKNKKYIVGDQLSIADLSLACTIGHVLNSMYGEDERKKFGPLVTWYLGIAGQNKFVEPKELSKKIHKRFQKKKEKGAKEGNEKKGEKNNKKEEKGNEKKNKKEETKQQKKENKVEEEDDLFGDSEPAKPAVAQPKPVKKEKVKPAAKSIVVFDVKVYEQEQDLNALFNKIKQNLVIDGLVWNNEPKILPVAFGMNKLQMGCVIEDAKVSIEEDVFEVLNSWEDEIQSVDTVSFQKL